MRKLKLQVQTSIDGYIAGPNGELDWMVWDWDDELKSFVTELTNPVDTILLGRKLAEGFIPHWNNAAQNPETADDAARKFSETPKVVFTTTLEEHRWPNTTLAKGDLLQTVTDLKNQPGGDLIAYGGATFVSALLRHGLIDDVYLFVNPVAIGQGLSIFDGRSDMKPAGARFFPCGIILQHYKP